MNIAGLDPMSSTSIARLGGTLSEEAGVILISQDGGLPMPVYWSIEALLTCCMVIAIVYMYLANVFLYVPLFE